MPDMLAYASGPEWDCDEDYIDIPGVYECWRSGYIDGQAKSDFNNTRNEECKDKGNQYDTGFSAADKN